MNRFDHFLKRSALVSLAGVGVLGLALPASAASFQWRQFAPGLVAAPAKSTPAPTPTPPAPAPQGSTVELTLSTATLSEAKLGTSFSYNFASLLSATGDPAYAANQVSWSATGLPAGLTFSGSTLSGTPEVLGISSITVTATFKDKSVSQTYSIDARYYSSCKALLQGNPATPSGSYTLDVDGSGAAPAMSYYCDMSNSGGGWTMIVQQYATSPVLSWAGGTNGNSFTLAANKIPSHSQVGFGQGNNATLIDYVNWTYSTGDIPVTLLAGQKNVGSSYQVFRSSIGFYNYHNPEEAFGGNSQYWVNSLTFDKTGGRFYSWAFAPNAAAFYGVNAPGFAINGAETYLTPVALPWTVWVR